MTVAVTEVALPPAARALSMLDHVDYADAFLIEPGAARTRTPEQWARAMLEDAPPRARRTLPWGWFALGLKQGSPQSHRHVLGWEVRRSTRDYALLGADSRLGMPAELLFKREASGFLFATFVQHDNPAWRAVWVGLGPYHRKVVRGLLERAVRAWRAD